MKLLISQKNQLFEAIQKSGLSPLLFEYTTKKENEILTMWEFKTEKEADITISYKDSEYSFQFYKNIKEFADIEFSPSKEIGSEVIRNTLNFSICLKYFISWLKYLKRELNYEDKWERFKSSIEEIDINTDDYNSANHFSIIEYEELTKKINELKTELSKISGLLPAQLNRINEELDHMSNMSKTLTKKDWALMFLGTIVSIIISYGLKQDIISSIWAAVKTFFQNPILIGK